MSDKQRRAAGEGHIYHNTTAPLFSLSFPQTRWQTGVQMAAHANIDVKLIEALK